MDPRPHSSETHDKLLLLYLLRASDLWLSELQVMRILSELGLMNYLSAKTALLELVRDRLLEEAVVGFASSYRIAPDGLDTITAFENDVRLSMREAVDAYLADHREALQVESTFRARVQSENGVLRVHLEIHSGGRPVFEIVADAESRDEAETMVGKWRQNAVKIYQSVLANLC